MIHNQNVCAVMVLYNPEDYVIKNLVRAVSFFVKVFVIDNSDKPNPSHDFCGMDSNDSLVYVANDANYGVAKALNQGAELAIKGGFSAAVLLDQDTKLSRSFLDELVYIYNDRSRLAPVAIVGSNYQISTALSKQKKARFVAEKTVITSGSLLNIEAYKGIGPFNESYFIDGVDLEFCLRAHLKGYGVYKSTKVLMEHFIGDATKHSLLGLTFITSNHSALRRYYLTRNTIFLCRSFFKSFFLYTVTGGINVVRIAVYIVLFESEKREKLNYMLLGLKDGFQNISGKKVLG
ncbi:MAG: glycosyltransferase [Cycloclasticus sp.]|uniref:glycosyltransferase n=1 Tax=Cycloclasticus sp. TaxID=2024830 RepID=UPI00257C743C|nr:glycosyltransferase [Cycloclasticus sp.]MBV1898681.1 glycosyltransferase [Cycloclasticus sp.]